MITGNKGEWSEIYTFLKLLGDKVLYAADSELNKLPDIYYPIISILREVGGKNLEFLCNANIKLVDSDSGKILTEIPVSTFRDKSLKLLEIMREGSGAFSVPEIESFLKGINITRITSPAKNKYDITLVAHDLRTGTNPKLHFSIKSMLGQPSTLFNPGRTTNFIFELIRDNLECLDEVKINVIDGVKNRVSKAKELGYEFKFDKIQSEILSHNLVMIDTNLCEILSTMLVLFYSGTSGNLKELVDKLETEDPLAIKSKYGHTPYEHKIKYFLLAAALGMTPSKVWDGNYSATGGYIIVKTDGEIVCYHIYNIDDFKDYLLKNTKLERPSTERYGYGKIYSEEGSLKMKLNLQIRFIK